MLHGTKGRPALGILTDALAALEMLHGIHDGVRTHERPRIHRHAELARVKQGAQLSKVRSYLLRVLQEEEPSHGRRLGEELLRQALRYRRGPPRAIRAHHPDHCARGMGTAMVTHEHSKSQCIEPMACRRDITLTNAPPFHGKAVNGGRKHVPALHETGAAMGKSVVWHSCHKRAPEQRALRIACNKSSRCTGTHHRLKHDVHPRGALLPEDVAQRLRGEVDHPASHHHPRMGVAGVSRQPWSCASTWAARGNRPCRCNGTSHLPGCR